MKLDFYEFVKFLDQGREIEIVFKGKKYYFAIEKNIYFMRTNISEIIKFKNIQELLDLKIQNYSIISVLSNLEDYIIY